MHYLFAKPTNFFGGYREKNSGFAVVHPVDTVIEVVEQEYYRRRDGYERNGLLASVSGNRGAGDVPALQQRKK